MAGTNDVADGQAREKINRQMEQYFVLLLRTYSSWWQHSDLQTRPAIVTSHQRSVNEYIWELCSRYEGFMVLDTNQIGRE